MSDHEDLREYPDAIDDENRHRPLIVGQPGTLDRDLWPPYRDGESCGARHCLRHVSKPCESCGRIAGRASGSQEKAP